MSNAAQPGAFVMPNLAGQTLGNVQSALRNAGLRLGETGGAGTASPASIVVSQIPDAGEKIVRGGAVNLQVR